MDQCLILRQRALAGRDCSMEDRICQRNNGLPSNSKYEEKKEEGQAKRKVMKKRCASSDDKGSQERDTEADI